MLLTDTSLPDSLARRLDEEQVQAINEAPRAQRFKILAAALVKTDPDTLDALAAAANLPTVTNLVADSDALGLLPARLIHDYQIIPIRNADFEMRNGESQTQPAEPSSGVAPASLTPHSEIHIPHSQSPLVLATSWPPDSAIVDWIRTFTPRPLVWYLGNPDKVHQLIIERFGVGSGSLEGSDDDYIAPENIQQADDDVDEDAAVVRFVTDVITQAVNDEATDIHFEPQEGRLQIRYRVDGLLVPVPVPENLLRFQDAIISRLKIMAKLNISEKRLPQDGRINFRAGGNVLDIRVATAPTIYAESVSLRLLNQKKEAYTMDRLGMSADEQREIKTVLEYPHGIILVTGPTGSGKSTSLNAFLRYINSPDLRIVTVEDPIEYEVPGVNQMQMKPEIGLTFATALRSILRQDPDVIMVGEIRDRDTADIAIRASLTGHLVFSTLHTNDAPGAITRLIDMGIEPFLVASAIELVIAQRLVRRLCPDCSKHEPVNKLKLRETLGVLGIDPDEADCVETLKVPCGCDRCRNTGYRGRIGIFEIFKPDEALHELILRRESTQALATCARENGMKPLQISGWEKVKAGHTTLDEIVRVIAAEK
ncbi:general secretion pathway protein E [Ereboglobus sp. PH5-10]|uniref:GspE/PulE family protein n=1 Tax=Ereboglobus sp. PH5-10 TaxID=2940629 RepID=UPI002405A494|nr:GspE/PulE family protein [Ereboglobus sp. PH5-10]MDF9826245.1 general secretion pathway protein E [Ereboglobus sp. PH5-10]